MAERKCSHGQQPEPRQGRTNQSEPNHHPAGNGTLNFFSYAGTRLIVDVAAYYTK